MGCRMRNRWIMVFLLVAFCGTTIPAVAVAQEDDEKQAVRVAQKLFEEGATAYSEKRFSEALTLFRKAHTYVPAAAFLYNAARAAEKLGNLEQSLSLAKQAKTQKTQPLAAQLVKKNDALIESLEKQIVAQKEAAERRKTMQWSWVGYSGVGVGVVGLSLVGGATYLGTQASSDIKALEDVEAREAHAQQREDILATQATAEVLLYSGVGLALVGGGIVAWDLLSPGESPLQVSTGPGDVGLSVITKF